MRSPGRRRDGFQALGGEAGDEETTRIRDNARYVVAALAQAGALEVCTSTGASPSRPPPKPTSWCGAAPPDVSC